MSRGYTPKGFLRQVPQVLLREYFDQKQVLASLDWSALEERDIEPVFADWQALPKDLSEQIESEFRAIHDLATPDGMRAIIEEGEFHKENLALALESIEGLHAKAMTVLLRHPKIFRVAGYMERADRLDGRYWRKRKGLPKRKPELTGEARRELTSAIRNYYWTKEGRGRKCAMDVYLRGGRRHYFFVYLDDYAETFVGFDGGAELVRRSQQPAFEIVFAYDEVDGTLELHARGDKKRKEDLQRIFGNALLRQDIGPEEKRSAPYDLLQLRNRGFSFQLSAADPVRSLRIKSLRLYSLADPWCRITLEGFLGDNPETTVDVYEMMDRTLDVEKQPLAGLGVDHATIEAKFPFREGWPERLTFSVSTRSCSLKDRAEELAIMECLKRCKVALV